jgi:hypothetical protein
MAREWRMQRSTPRQGEPATWGRSARKDAARTGNFCRTRRVGEQEPTSLRGIAQFRMDETCCQRPCHERESGRYVDVLLTRKRVQPRSPVREYFMRGSVWGELGDRLSYHVGRCKAQQAYCDQVIRQWQRVTPGLLPPGHQARGDIHTRRLATRRFVSGRY